MGKQRLFEATKLMAIIFKIVFMIFSDLFMGGGRTWEAIVKSFNLNANIKCYDVAVRF